MNPPDGRIDPGGATLQALNGGAPVQPHGGAGRFPADVIAAAQAAHEKWNIPASITLAQWALESGYGRSMPAGSNNPFGIKAAAGQPFVEASTREVIDGQSVTIVAKFRKFNSMSDAFDQHGQLLATGRPYAAARTHLDDPDAFADALTGVYATDPNYGTALKRLMKSNDLYQYD
jgi:flagellum-specific peptidoglycan hydrolase FlgJ